MLVAAAGMGKTALTRRCLSSWRARALSASGDPGETSLSGGLLDQLAGGPGSPRPNPAGAAGDRRRRPVIGWIGAAQRVQGDTRSEAGRRVIDDAQWGDELSLRALSFAVRRMHGDPCLCIVVTRPEDLHRLPPGLVRAVDDRGTRLDLAALDASTWPNLPSSSVPASAAPCCRAAAGPYRWHPFACQGTAARLARCRAANSWVRRACPAVPGDTSAVAAAGCAPETEHLVVATAVLGADTRLADAAALAGLADPLPALQEAVQQRLLKPGAADERRCVFPRSLIRAAVYRDIGVSRRAQLHRAAAGLTTGSAALAHRVAGCSGPDPGLAADLEARRSRSWPPRRPEAVEHLLTSVQVDDRGPERDARLLTAVGMLIDLGDAARARTYASEVTALPPSASRSLVLGRLAMLAGDYRPAEDWIDNAWVTLAQAQPPEAVTRGGKARPLRPASWR